MFESELYFWLFKMFQLDQKCHLNVKCIDSSSSLATDVTVTMTVMTTVMNSIAVSKCYVIFQFITLHISKNRQVNITHVAPFWSVYIYIYIYIYIYTYIYIYNMLLGVFKCYFCPLLLSEKIVTIWHMSMDFCHLHFCKCKLAKMIWT